MRKLNPFGQRRFESHPVTVGDSTIYLLKKGAITPKENPLDVQEGARKRAELSGLLITATLAISKQQNCSPEHAEKLMRGYTTPEGIEVEGISPLSALSDEDVKRWVALQDDARMTGLKVASLFIKYRLCYHVTLAANARAKTGTISVEPLRYPMVEGDRIKFDDVVIELQESADADAEELSIKPLSKNLEVGRVGFLLDFETRREKVGLPSWTAEDTAELLTEPQVDAVYEFYQMETGATVTESEAKQPSDPVGNLPPSELTAIPSRSTGSNSGSESNDMELPIQCSVMKTLETAPIG